MDTLGLKDEKSYDSPNQYSNIQSYRFLDNITISKTHQPSFGGRKSQKILFRRIQKIVIAMLFLFFYWKEK